MSPQYNLVFPRFPLIHATHICLCSNGEPQCYINYILPDVYPGERFTESAVVMGGDFLVPNSRCSSYQLFSHWARRSLSNVLATFLGLGKVREPCPCVHGWMEKLWACPFWMPAFMCYPLMWSVVANTHAQLINYYAISIMIFTTSFLSVI